jgi:hypothetical protein
VCLEGVLRNRDGSEVTDEEIKEKTTTLYSFFLGSVVSARNDIKKRYRKLKGTSFHLTCHNPNQQQYNH